MSSCKRCRYEKCIRMGMRPECVQNETKRKRFTRSFHKYATHFQADLDIGSNFHMSCRDTDEELPQANTSMLMTSLNSITQCSILTSTSTAISSSTQPRGNISELNHIKTSEKSACPAYLSSSELQTTGVPSEGPFLISPQLPPSSTLTPSSSLPVLLQMSPDTTLSTPVSWELPSPMSSTMSPSTDYNSDYYAIPKYRKATRYMRSLNSESKLISEESVTKDIEKVEVEDVTRKVQVSQSRSWNICHCPCYTTEELSSVNDWKIQANITARWITGYSNYRIEEDCITNVVR